MSGCQSNSAKTALMDLRNLGAMPNISSAARIGGGAGCAACGQIMSTLKASGTKNEQSGATGTSPTVREPLPSRWVLAIYQKNLRNPILGALGGTQEVAPQPNIAQRPSPRHFGALPIPMSTTVRISTIQPRANVCGSCLVVARLLCRSPSIFPNHQGQS